MLVLFNYLKPFAARTSDHGYLLKAGDFKGVGGAMVGCA